MLHGLLAVFLAALPYTSRVPAPSRSAEFLSGVRAQLPLLVGVTPFGLAYGAYAVDSGLSVSLAQAMSAIVFAGASQVVAVELIASGAPALVLIATVALVNLRHMLYSASLAPHVDHLPPRWRWLLSYLLTDEAYAMAIARYRQPDASPHRHWFFFGTGFALWACWQASTAAGVFGGQAVPESWALDFALPLTFIAILVPALSDRPALAAAALAGLVAVVGFDWPYGLGLLAAALVGIIGGMTMDYATGRRDVPRGMNTG